MDEPVSGRETVPADEPVWSTTPQGMPVAVGPDGRWLELVLARYRPRGAAALADFAVIDPSDPLQAAIQTDGLFSSR
ncbi:MAG TPA: hypothetical protein VIT45_12500 [Allosphingosinicella sp.]